MASKSSRSLAVIIPMHNEELGAERCVTAVVAVLKTLPVRTKLIAVNDGSEDQTALILARLSQKGAQNLKVVSHPQNQGYGAGLATGIKVANEMGFSHVCFMDSDLTNDPADLMKFVGKMEFDLVKASRYMEGGKMRGVPWGRRLISQGGNLLARICFRMGIHDYTNGFRMAKTKLLAGYEYQEKGFAIILEEMYWLKRKKARCSEIPVTLTARVTTASHFHYTFRQIWSYLKYALKAAII